MRKRQAKLPQALIVLAQCHGGVASLRLGYAAAPLAGCRGLERGAEPGGGDGRLWAAACRQLRDKRVGTLLVTPAAPTRRRAKLSAPRAFGDRVWAAPSSALSKHVVSCASDHETQDAFLRVHLSSRNKAFGWRLSSNAHTRSAERPARLAFNEAAPRPSNHWRPPGKDG